MNATARLVAAPEGRITAVRSEPPLTFRNTPDAVYLVGSAGGPLGGDDLRIVIDVEPGACVTVRSAAASVALPGRGSAPSTLSIEAHVAAGGELRWLVEPTVAARRCRHHIDAHVDLDGTARLLWLEEIVLGRHGEQPGSVTSRLSVDLGGQPLLRHELALGPDHGAAATSVVVGDARAVGTAVVVGGGGAECTAATLLGDGGQAAVLPLAGPGFQVVALAHDRITLRRLLDEGVSFSPSSVLPSAMRRP